MKLGVTFPLSEIGNDPGGIKAYAQAAEELGFDSVHCGDHIVGTDPRVHPEFTLGYTHLQPSLDPLVLFAFLGAVTTRIGFTTGVLLLAERQTVLVAKQAASLDVLTNGRLRLGVGIGGFEPEFEPVGEEFRNRGERSEEQIALMRALWTQESVTFRGRWHTVVGFGSNPLPVQRPIPIWLGGQAEAVLERTGRLADGWLLAREKPSEAAGQAFDRVRGYAKAAGRDPAALGFEGRVHLIDGGTIESCVEETHAWERLGATHVVLMTLFGGLQGPDEHIGAMRRYKEMVGFP